MNGRVAERSAKGMKVQVDQAFGNCPQYIQARAIERLKDDLPAPIVEPFTGLTGSAQAAIAAADTFFVASYLPAGEQPAIEGVDVSHRGGRAGFVKVSGNTLTVPDFPGNHHFNTLGNFLLNPRAGLTFVDFDRGDLLQVTGTVVLLQRDHPAVQGFRGAERAWQVRVDKGQWLRRALPLRFNDVSTSPNNALTDTWAEAAARKKGEALRNQWRTHRVVRIEQETDRIRSFYLAPADGGPLLAHAAGQLLPVRVDERVRTYTLSSAPGDAYYRISVKREDQGAVSRYLHDSLREGDLIEARGPRGTFVVDDAGRRPLLLIGGGVGITPMIAMAKHLANEALRTRRARSVTVFHAARSPRALAFADEFARLADGAAGGIAYRTVVSAPDPASAPRPDFVGRLDADMLRAVLPLDDYDVYLCGPGEFMQSVYRALRGLGVADERIHAEAFGPSALKRDVAAASTATAETAVIDFAASQVEAVWSASDGSVLEFAEQHGLAPEFGCRNGACGTCATRVVGGRAVNRQTGAIGGAGDDVLICCAAPAPGTDRLTLDT